MTKKIIVLAVLLLASVMGYAAACPTGASYFFTIPIPAQTGMSGSISGFPFQFQGNAALKTTGNGGNVTSSSGLDVWFCTAATSGTLLPYELAPGSYVATTGVGLWDIQAPTVSNSTSQTIYGFAGLASPTDQSCGPSGYNNCSSTLWSGYLMVYHFLGGSLYNSVDFTTGTNHGTTSSATGPLGGGISCSAGSLEWADSGNIQTGLTNFTMEYFAEPAAVSPTTYLLASSRNSGTTGGTFGIQSSPGSGNIVGVGYSNGANFYYRVTSSLLPSTSYSGIAGSHTSGSANMTLYFNGASQGTTGSSGSPTDPANSGTTMQFCRDGADPTPYYYSGGLAEYRLANVAQSANWEYAVNASVSSPSTFAGFVATTAATPTFSPSTGAPPQTVTISTATSGCGSYIYWSTVHNPPTTSDTNGTSVSVVSPETVYADVIGCPGYNNSAVGSATYSSSGVVPTSLSLIVPF